MERYPSGQREQTVNLPAYAFEGSNPSLSTMLAGVAQLVRASAFQAEGREFESRLPLHFLERLAVAAAATSGLHAHVAQLVEHVLGKDEVTGSIPVVGSRSNRANFAVTRRSTAFGIH
jgi:hypothetical protein